MCGGSMAIPGIDMVTAGTLVGSLRADLKACRPGRRRSLAAAPPVLSWRQHRDVRPVEEQSPGRRSSSTASPVQPHLERRLRPFECSIAARRALTGEPVHLTAAARRKPAQALHACSQALSVRSAETASSTCRLFASHLRATTLSSRRTYEGSWPRQRWPAPWINRFRSEEHAPKRGADRAPRLRPHPVRGDLPGRKRRIGILRVGPRRLAREVWC